MGMLAVVGVLGAAYMAVAHRDIGGPGLALGLAGGALLYAAVAYAVFTAKAWAWPIALVVNGITLAVTTMPFRGGLAAVPVAVSVVALAILVSPPGRAALLSE